MEKSEGMYAERGQENWKDTASSQWKYFNQMQFLRPSIEQSKPEWSNDEKRSLINFYNTNPSL